GGNMTFKTKLTNRILKSIFIVSLLIFMIQILFSKQESTTRINQNIPEGANKIIFKQKLLPPSGIYLDVLHHLEKKGFRILALDDVVEAQFIARAGNRNQILLSAKKQLKDSLALRMTFLIKPGNELNSGKLVTSSIYSRDAQLPLHKWQRARWTTPEASKAFYETIEIMKEADYEIEKFEEDNGGFNLEDNLHL
ncbi:MAG: hypothetical protein K9M80_09320, partial [Candidatus Marinimicrobia bacterium]|nr:hypothetical protein [Candidatus Neomarinimicrobiota bacterium]